jgi:hypothetical protein
MVRSFFAILIILGFAACQDQSGRKSMSKISPQQTKRGAIRQGTTIKAAEHKLRFEIPAAWVRWYEENEAHPNLHLTSAELDAVKETEGDWDREFALVVNAILPFDQCIAHVGDDGWGPRGISYADLQVRAYVLTATPEEIEERARLRGSEVIINLTETPAVSQQDQVGAWRRTLLKYFRWYIDYGATAIVDLRIRRYDNRSVVFAFMYTDHSEHDAEIEAILDSVVFTDE